MASDKSKPDQSAKETPDEAALRIIGTDSPDTPGVKPGDPVDEVQQQLNHVEKQLKEKVKEHDEAYKPEDQAQIRKEVERLYHLKQDLEHAKERLKRAGSSLPVSIGGRSQGTPVATIE